MNACACRLAQAMWRKAPATSTPSSLRRRPGRCHSRSCKGDPLTMWNSCSLTITTHGSGSGLGVYFIHVVSSGQGSRISYLKYSFRSCLWLQDLRDLRPSPSHPSWQVEIRSASRLPSFPDGGRQARRLEAIRASLGWEQVSPYLGLFLSPSGY